MLSNADIAVLHKGIKHYDLTIDPMEVLYRWISGFRPLPACAYSESCLNVSYDESKFCQEHSCKFTQDGKHFCHDAVVHKRLYCERHLCSAEKCKNCRMDEVQLFCEDHACFVCLARDEKADVAVDEPPRNTCDRHPLCWALGGMCTEVTEPSFSYCKMHKEVLYCKWVSKGGESCGEIATTGQYCGGHHVEAQALSEREAQMSTGKCQARTRKGKPCKASPLSGSRFCRDHVGRSNQPVMKFPDVSLKTSVQEETKEAIEIPKSPSVDELSDAQGSQSSELDRPNAEKEEAVDIPEKNEDLWSSGSEVDVDDFVDAVQYDNEDEVEESEHLQHMRDVYEVEDDEVEVEIEAVEAFEEEEKTPWTFDQQLMRPHEWHWDLTLEERWNALFSVLNLWSDLNTRLQHAFVKQLEDLKVELQREILRANSRVYEGKSVIGGTITGCVSRLEAIRTTNPFAILVEEASEVMEPLLVSCFSSSTRKLEMIGDHMQLQPSVMGKIDFERVNKINISMFERLISAPQGNEVPSSVLSIQRRMRKNICDLTLDADAEDADGQVWAQKMSKERDPRPVPSCFLSTVDRFQGDEADIVIISLVIDGKSRTPFVKLQNRMIVLLSRARLGMYVVGNVEYFGETTHWKKTFEVLENDAESDNNEAVECTAYTGPRVGAALPICCPEHRESVALAMEESHLKLGFCTVCEVESSCSRHPRVLKCSAVTASSGRSIDEALEKYQCDIRVDVSLPCGHNQKMKCFSHTEIEAGRSSWPVCNKEAIAPYVYSECKHILKCTCNEFDRYSKGHAPPCTEKVEYTPACQHTVTQPCHDRQDYITQVRRYVCKEKVKEKRLRDKVAQYSGRPDDVDPVEIVNEGDSSNYRKYGLNVHCTHEVTYARVVHSGGHFGGSWKAAKCFEICLKGVYSTCTLLSATFSLGSEAMDRFKHGLDVGVKWSNLLFLPLEIPVFVVLSRKLQGKEIDRFEIKDFGSQQTLNGIEVYEATQENFERVVSGGKASLLFGHLYSAKSLRNPTDIPKAKGKNGSSHDYDALYRDAKAGKKGGTWIVWYPHALFPVHRVEITDANRETIARCLPERTQVNQQPPKISFEKPTGVTTEEEDKPAITLAPTVISDEDIDKLRVLAASVSPLFEKLNVWYPWDGKSFSTGAAEAISQRMEKTLMSKLNFVLADSTQQKSKKPFGGIKYVENAQSQGKLKEDGNLFLALELLAVRKQDTSETRLKLEEYVTRVCAEEGGYAHPLVIVALARLAVRSSQTQSSDVQRKLLQLFASLYPEASSLWLNEAELRLKQRTNSQATTAGSFVSGSPSVEDKWESLKSQYSCRSKRWKSC
ncbi:hypothetical protein PInf_018593 [Phytophthora infestans]|nr:hypothetical protein PInf_018593 [Phytophthora infestans]